MPSSSLVNKLIPHSLVAGVAITAAIVASSSVQAADLDFRGTFQNDNDVLLFNFNVDTDSTITIFSSSWLYGDAPVGEPLGGFDPILALWDSAGNLIAQQDDGYNVGSTVSNGVSYNHGTWDTYFTQFLMAGTYTVSITQVNNFPVSTNLSDGFQQDGNPNFTFDQNYGGATQPLFNGIWLSIGPGNDDIDPRTNQWEFHILNVADAEVVEPVPEPASLAGLLAFGALAAGSSLKRKFQAKSLG
jgi:hypothetical protein